MQSSRMPGSGVVSVVAHTCHGDGVAITGHSEYRRMGFSRAAPIIVAAWLHENSY